MIPMVLGISDIVSEHDNYELERVVFTRAADIRLKERSVNLARVD